MKKICEKCGRECRVAAMLREKPKHICRQCGREFENQRGKALFCSAECAGAARRRKNRVCPHCGKAFYPVTSGTVFCSAECRRAAQAAPEKKWHTSDKKYEDRRRGVMGSFAEAQAFTAAWEGGLTEHPNDPGGITNYGVSLAFLRELAPAEADINGDGEIGAQDIRELTKEQAADLFRAHFWKPLYCEEYAQPAAMALYDAAVNCGRRQAVLFAQRAVNALDGKLVEDGKLGPKTRAELCAASGEGGMALAFGICSQREAFYRALVKKKPALSGFLAGWLRRLSALEEACRYA